MLSLFSKLRNRNKKVMEQKASDMDPEKRSALTEDILNSGITDASTKQDMEDIERDLEQASETLAKAVESEEFVGLRFRKYQSLLRERAKELVEVEEFDDDDDAEDATQGDAEYSSGAALIENSDDEDDEAAADEEAGEAKISLTPEQRLVQVEKLQRDEAALFKVEQQYATLQETTRALKKKVFLLERRRDIILQQTSECEEFVIAAAVADGRDEAGFQDDGEPQRAPWAAEEDMNNLNINDSDDDDNRVRPTVVARPERRDSNVDDDIEESAE